MRSGLAFALGLVGILGCAAGEGDEPPSNSTTPLRLCSQSFAGTWTLQDVRASLDPGECAITTALELPPTTLATSTVEKGTLNETTYEQLTWTETTGERFSVDAAEDCKTVTLLHSARYGNDRVLLIRRELVATDGTLRGFTSVNLVRANDVTTLCSARYQTTAIR